MQKTSERKTLKVVVLIICAMGFLHRVTAILRIYLEYSTSVNSQPYADYLSVTFICIQKGLDKASVCKNGPADTCTIEKGNWALCGKLRKSGCQEKKMTLQIIRTDLRYPLNSSCEHGEQNEDKGDDLINTGQIQNLTETNHCKNSENITQVRFRDMKLMIFCRCQQKYEIMEMLHDIGNSMGIWLGISFVSLYDLINMFTQLLCYPLEWRKGRKTQQGVISNVAVTTLQI